jgi:hypothetical protein
MFINALTSEASQKDLDYIATLLGLPTVDNIPRPGDVGDWRFPEWKEWGKDYGFTDEDRSTHAFVLRHHTLPLLISVSSSPSDRRSGLAFGTEFRRMVLAELRQSHALAGCALLEKPDISDDELKAKLTDPKWRQATQDQANERRIAKMAGHETDVREALLPTLTALNKYGYTTKVAFNRAGLDDIAANRAVEVLKHDMVPKIPNMDDVLDALNDLLAGARDDEVAEMEQKEKARQAREEAKKRDEPRIDKGEVTFNAESARSKSRLTGAVKCVQDRVSQLHNALQAVTALSTDQLIPPYPKARMDELIAEASAANEKLLNASAERDILETASAAQTRKIQELEHLLEDMRREKRETEDLFLEAATAPEWRSACIRLIERVTPLLASDNFLKLAQGVAEARDTLAAAKIAIDANTPPVL